MNLFRKFKRLNWLLCSIQVLIFVNTAFCCSRKPEGSVPPPSPADGRFIISIAGNPQKYEPGQTYNISLQSIVTPSGTNTFIGFFLAVMMDDDDPFNSSDLSKVGRFEIIDSVETVISSNCRNIVKNTNLTPKTKITVSWTAPKPGNGCLFFKATVIEHNKVWYKDDGALTKEFCEEQSDDIDNQPAILSECCACDEAKYELTFEGRWSRHTHPKDFPANQWETRFSDIVGASHSSEHLFWKYGEHASDGLREVAEHGSTRKLESELKENSEHIRTIIKARGLEYPNVTGKTFAVFRVDPEHHLISLVSKIHPSPDWIVGVSALELCLPNCTWIPHKIHNLYPWDAGTDGGTSYMSPDQPLLHPEPIRRITSRSPYQSPFFDSSGLPMEPLARIHITQTRLYEKNCDEDGGGKGETPLECATYPWTKWSECSSKCGSGTRYRSRQFKNPVIASKFGKCKVQLSQTQDCTGDKCDTELGSYPTESPPAPECDVTDWSEWSECTEKCGKGKMTRTRKFKIRKAHKFCKELNIKLEETVECYGEDCAGPITPEVDENIPSECVVSDWSNWSPCSCDENNIRTRVREVFIHEGYRGSRDPNPCEDIQTTEEVKCRQSDCEKQIPDFCYSPVEVGTCREGTTSGYWYYDYTVDSCAMFFIFTCESSDAIENKFNSKKDCERTCRPKSKRSKHNHNKETLQSESLRYENYIEKVDCKLSEWTVHACNATCGEGYQVKTRKVLVTAKNGGKPCPKKMVRIEKCFARCADEYSESYRRRKPLSSSSFLDEEIGSADGSLGIEDDDECKYSEWSSWSPCTERCGENSIRQRTRTVLNNRKQHKCKDKVQTERCNVPPCLLASRNCKGPYCW